MDYKKILQSLEQKKYAPVYLIDGEETYYLDIITDYFEEKILAPSERDFNLLVLYGKDVTAPDVINACRRFPMFAERQVVILKDAAQMKGLNDLVGYLDNPTPSTVFLIEHKFKKVDGRGKLGKVAKDKGVYFTSEKVKDEHMPYWIETYGKEIGFSIGTREAQILATFLGNDLQKVANEIEKVRINVPDEPTLTVELIQKYIGVSRDYNVFEFSETLTNGDKDKLYRMLSYFVANPKSAPMPLLIGSLYNHFSKIHQGYFVQQMPERDASKALGLFANRFRDVMAVTKRVPIQNIEYCMMLLGKYSTQAVGIDSNVKDTELLKEMVGKMEMALG